MWSSVPSVSEAIGSQATLRHELVVVARERLVLGQPVAVPPDVPEQAALGHVAEPLHAVGEDGDGRVDDRRALQRPARVAGHDLVEGEALLGAADEEVAPQLRDGDHDAGLADQPRVGGAVVHDAAGPRHGPLGLEAVP